MDELERAAHDRKTAREQRARYQVRLRDDTVLHFRVVAHVPGGVLCRQPLSGVGVYEPTKETIKWKSLFIPYENVISVAAGSVTEQEQEVAVSA